MKKTFFLFYVEKSISFEVISVLKISTFVAKLIILWHLLDFFLLFLTTLHNYHNSFNINKKHKCIDFNRSSFKIHFDDRKGDWTYLYLVICDLAPALCRIDGSFCLPPSLVGTHFNTINLTRAHLGFIKIYAFCISIYVQEMSEMELNVFY